MLIFPEGTRRAPGAAPDYKSGAVALYEGLGLPCVPVALNSGLYWPRRQMIRYPGTIIVEILDPLPAGLPRAEFRAKLQQRIEDASMRLILEAARSSSPPPISADVLARAEDAVGATAIRAATIDQILTINEQSCMRSAPRLHAPLNAKAPPDGRRVHSDMAIISRLRKTEPNSTTTFSSPPS